jgi:hypothetical protein
MWLPGFALLLQCREVAVAALTDDNEEVSGNSRLE